MTYPVDPRFSGGPAPIRAPRHLRLATRQFWASVNDEYCLEAPHRKLLTMCCEAWDRCQQAREALKKHDSLTFTDRFGQPHARPEVNIERDSRIAFARLLRELGLDIEGPREPGRPPAIRG